MRDTLVESVVTDLLETSNTAPFLLLLQVFRILTAHQGNGSVPVAASPSAEEPASPVSGEGRWVMGYSVNYVLQHSCLINRLLNEILSD